MRRLPIALLLLGLCLVPASASVLTFESLASNGSDWTWSGLSYQEAGFRITSSILFSAQIGNSLSYAGSTVMASAVPNETITLTRTNGDIFTLNAIDLAPFGGGRPVGAQVVFTGTRPDNSTLTATFAVPGTLTFNRYTFSGFTGLESVSWVHAYPFHQFDNIDAIEATVPEASTWILLASALAIFGIARVRIAMSR